MCALAKGNLIPGASSRLEAESPNDAGRYDGRGEDRGSPAELLRAMRLSRLARPVSDQRHFVALLYTLSRDTTLQWSGQKSGGDSAISSQFVIAGMIFHPSRVKSELLHK